MGDDQKEHVLKESECKMLSSSRISTIDGNEYKKKKR